MVPGPHIAQELLSQVHPPEIASTIFTDKVLHKPIHLRPTSPDPTCQDARAQRRQQRLRKEDKFKKRRKVKPLSAKEKRITGVYDIPRDARIFDLYAPLNRMWMDYMREIIGNGDGKSIYVTAQSKGSIMASADYHGAELTVVRAYCASLVGLQGIVIKDTKFTFQIITRRNEMKVIPKRYAIFRFEIPQTLHGHQADQESLEAAEKGKALETPDPIIFELHGSQFEQRATDRSTKKFKQRYLKDL